MMRARHSLVALTLAAIVVSSGCAGADALAFDARARGVEQTLVRYVADGVPSPSLDGIRVELQGLKARRSGPVPYAVVSGAAVRDPFLALEDQALAVRLQAVQASRLVAEAALDQLRGEPEATGLFYDDIVELGRASTPAGYRALAARSRTQLVEIQLAKRELAGAGGGLAGGLPADLVAGEAQLRDLIAAADVQGLLTDPGPATLVDVQIYLAQPYLTLVDRHGAIADELATALRTVQKRVDMRAHGLALFGELPGLLGQMNAYGGGDADATRAEQYRVELMSVHSDDELAKAVTDLQGLVDEMSGSFGSGRLPLAGVACIAGAPSQQIVIHLATQQLVAYDAGCPILRTPITTGRPALPTDRGTFRIFYKTPAYKMVSPWPPGSPFWYQDAWVYWAMEFVGDGTFIHNADWQPDSTYGPGSQFGPYASHGCVHVLDGPLQSLYAWAQLGATVVVED